MFIEVIDDEGKRGREGDELLAQARGIAIYDKLYKPVPPLFAVPFSSSQDSRIVGRRPQFRLNHR